MTYQSIARRWRPRSFQEVVGHEGVVQALSYALDQHRVHPAYLFTGTRGIGKTTFARILARCLNCEQGPTATPCGVCAHCVAMDEGTSLDLNEVDAASKTKVEETRALLENVHYAPAQSRYKIFLIDEVHMLSTHSFNALLKTLEEPPAHVCFILATTELEKVPETVRSRCVSFVLKPLSVDQLVTYLRQRLVEENMAFEEAALCPLAEAGRGSVRDTLTLLEQVLAYGQGMLKAEGVTQLLGIPLRGTLFQLLSNLWEKNLPDLRSLIRTQLTQGVDPERLLRELLILFKDLTWVQLDPETALEIGSADEQPLLKSWANRFRGSDLQAMYDIGIRAQEAWAFSPSPQVAFEMALLRMAAYRPVESPSPCASQKVDTSPSTPVPLPVPAKLDGGLVTVTTPVVDPNPQSECRAEPRLEPTTCEPNSKPDPDPIAMASPFNWPAFCFNRLCTGSTDRLSAFDQSILMHALWLDHHDLHVKMGLTERGKTLFDLAPQEQEPLTQRVILALQDAHPDGTKIRTLEWVRLDLADSRSGQETPFQYKARTEREKQEACQAAMAQDPQVTALQSAFGGVEVIFEGKV